MESYLISSHYDLVTPDGEIQDLQLTDKNTGLTTVIIKNISPAFIGFNIDPNLVFFNLKSTLAQIGINGIGLEYFLDKKRRHAEVKVQLTTLSPLGEEFLPLLSPGSLIGKLFAADDRRKVRNSDYLLRMFGRVDQNNNPLLSFGLGKKDRLILEKTDGFTIAYIALKKGILIFEPLIKNFLPTLAKAVKHKEFNSREMLKLHQRWERGKLRLVEKDKALLVRTSPLHIRTVFANVVENLLPAGFHHTTASILQPDTTASGDIYELFGASRREITYIPLEFYTLEPHREYVFFSDRDQLQANLDDPNAVFKAFQTSPPDQDNLSAVFIVKGKQLQSLSPKDWIVRKPSKQELPGFNHPLRQAMLVENYIKQQPSYPFLKAIEENLITSQGVLFSRYFPSPLLKRMFLSSSIQRCLKRIYFQYPSFFNGDYFSHEDRALLTDLAKFAIPVFWVDETCKKILQYVVNPNKDVGMFVPIPFIETFTRATFFGVYGSNLLEGNFEIELKDLLNGVLEMRKEMNHPLLCFDTPLALVTGGGPGAMKVGNRVAKDLGILSCANIIDFRQKENSVINEQQQNPYIDAKMTYRLDRLVERQAEFHLDFPICLVGGIGMDFEFILEEVRRKVGAVAPTPVILFGSPLYWKEKITPRFQCNLKKGTIRGSEWISNCFFCVQTARQAKSVYYRFFKGLLPIGKEGPIYNDGFSLPSSS